jgi:hypothetical protein
MPGLDPYPTFLLGSPASRVPLTLCENFPGVGLAAYRTPPFGAGVPMDGLAGAVNCGFRRGLSGRGSEGLDFLNCGLGALPGPTD